MKRHRMRRSLGYSSGRLSQKAVVVTGGASPLGLFMAQGFVQEGASVLIVCHTPSRQAIMVDPGSGSPEQPAPVLWSAGDTRRKAYCRAVINYALERFGRLDALINNADFEFIQSWPPQYLQDVEMPADTSADAALNDEEAADVEIEERSIPITGEADEIPFSEDVSQNFTLAALDTMQPGSVMIHLQAPDRMIPLSLHPSLSVETGAPVVDDAETRLLQNGVRVARIEPGSLWVAGLFDQLPQDIPEDKAFEVFSLIDYCISIISKV